MDKQILLALPTMSDAMNYEVCNIDEVRGETETQIHVQCPKVFDLIRERSADQKVINTLLADIIVQFKFIVDAVPEASDSINTLIERLESFRDKENTPTQKTE